MFGYRDSQVKVTESKIGGDTTIIGPSYIDKSIIADNADIIKSSIYDSNVVSYSTVLSSVMLHSHVSGQAKVFNSKLYKSVVCENAKVIDANLDLATVEGGAMVIGAEVKGVTVRDEAVVSGIDTKVEGDFTLDGGMIIHSGLWTRAPKILYAKLSRYTVQECVNGNIHINCTCNTPEKWLGGAGLRLGRMMGLNPEQSHEIIGLIRIMRDLV
jgi:hypothetical protein